MGVERIWSELARDDRVQPTFRRICTIYYVVRSLRRRHRVGPSGARKFCPKFLNITIPSLFLAALLPDHPLHPKEEPVFLIAARERRFFPARSPPPATYAWNVAPPRRHSVRTEHARRRRIQDERRRVRETHADPS